MSVLLKNGLVVTSTGSYVADVFVDGEKIKSIGSGLSVKADETVDATGKYILPGAIDPHTHIEMPFMGTTSSDDWKTGSVAAACGGTTTIIDFSLQGKGEMLQDAVERQKGKANGKSVVDFSIHPGVTDARPEVIEEVKKAIHEYGTPSFKIFLFYDFRVDDYTMIRLLEETKKHGGLVQVHAESFDMIRRLNEQFEAAKTLDPIHHAWAHAALAEEEAVDRAAKAVEFTGSRIYIVHLSSSRGLWKIKQARDRGVRIQAETCPQYLTLTEDRYKEPNWNGAKYVMSPPLRCQESLDELWLGLRDGDVQTVGTDHCPFNFKGQKDMAGKDDYRKIPNGAPGHRDHAHAHAHRGSREGPHHAGAHGGRPVHRHGADVRPGRQGRHRRRQGCRHRCLRSEDGKFTITQKKLHQNVDYTPWEGWEMTGMPDIVYSRGKARGRMVRRPDEVRR